MNKTELKPHDWIVIGEKALVYGVICWATPETTDTYTVVYNDNKGVPIAEEVKWNDEFWDFVIKGPCGSYARNNSTYSAFVATLKAGRFSQR